jgi:hypothetical protein
VYSARIPPAPVKIRAEVKVSKSTCPDAFKLVVVELLDTRFEIVEEAAFTTIAIGVVEGVITNCERKDQLDPVPPPPPVASVPQVNFPVVAS